MDVAVTGSSGLIGTALKSALSNAGHRPIAVVRSPASGQDQIFWKPSEGQIDAASFNGLDAVIHLAGAGIGDRKWTESRKKLLVESRTTSTSLLAGTLAGLDHPPSTLISGSAIGFYGDGSHAVNETSPHGTGFLADLVVAWEEAARPAVEADGIRVAFARTGIVQSKQGGALGKQLPIFKLGAGGRLGSGNQWVSWISMTDQVGALQWILDNDNVSGPVNLTAPNPVTNLEYTKALGAAVNRPTFIPIPMFGPKILFGSEMVEEMLVSGQKVMPQVLLDGGYRFAHRTIEEALAFEISRTREVA